MPKINFDIDDGQIIYVPAETDPPGCIEVPSETLERWRKVEEAFTLVQAEMWDILQAYRDSQEKGKQAKLDAQTDAIAEEALGMTREKEPDWVARSIPLMPSIASPKMTQPRGCAPRSRRSCSEEEDPFWDHPPVGKEHGD